MLDSASTLAMLAAAKASVGVAIEKISRWPAGAAGGKGGQFAPGKQGGLFGDMDGWGLSPSAKAPPPPSARPHTKVDDKGAEVLVHYPSKPTGPESWLDKGSIATAIPGGKMPASLHGVAFKPWVPPTDWRKVDGTDESLDAGQPLNATDKQRPGAGVVILEPDGRMWLTKPTNEFGGYEHSWPKGGVEEGMTLQQTAIKEAWEETGLKVKITGVLGDYEGDTSKARYYVARRVGGTPADMGWESQAMRLVPPNKLKSLLNRPRDKLIATDILDLLKDEGIYKAVPTPLYIRRDLQNADEVRAWAMAQGFATTLPASQMHVTIAYSKTPVDWQAMGSDVDELTADPVVEAVDTTRHVERLGANGEAVVLRFSDTDLETRWRQLVDLGASWDWDGYKPHVTISWNAPDLDLSKVQPYTGRLVFGPEIFEPIDEGWKDKLVEKAKKPSGGGGAFDQPRWPAGSPLGGQWKAADGGGIPTPPSIAGGLAGKNASYQKQANALYSALKAGDQATVKAAVDKLGEKVAANSAKGAKTSHVKWTAQLHQYGQSLLGSGAKVEQAVAAADAIRGPMKLSGMQKTGSKPGGSAPGALYTDKGGMLWLVKGNAQAGTVSQKVSDNRAKNEVLASHLLNAVGAGAPEMKLVDLGKEHGGGIGVGSKWVTGTQKFNPGNKAHLSAAQQQFAVHAWLGNYDVIGAEFDNTVIKDGKALCIDPGGSILFRAQGKPKDPGAFGDKVDELKTLRDPKINKNAAAVYGSMTASQIAESCAQLKQIDDATITKLVDSYGPGDAKEKAKLAATLIKRRDHVIQYGESLQAAPAPAPVPAPKPPRPASKQPTTPAADDFDDFDDDMMPELEVPTFKTGFAKTDKAYTMAAAYVKSMHDKAAAGNGIAMLWLNNAQGLVQQGQIDTGLGMQKIQPGSVSAQKLHAFIGDAKASAQVQFIAADAAVAAAATAEAAKAKAAADAAVKAQHVALPDFDGAKLPAGNTNAGSHNAKVDAIKSLAASGDVNGILALNYGTNTYGKKQAQLANDALAALGSAEKVAPGQKKGEHPTISGAPTAKVADADAGAIVAEPVKPAVAAATKAVKAATKEKKAPVFKPETLLAPPDFKNWPGKGGPLSSSDAVNASNNEAVRSIYEVAKKGDLEALQALKFEVVDKATGQKTGALQSIKDHPSQHVKAYWQNLVTEVDLQVNPPAMPELGQTVRDIPLEAASISLPTVEMGKMVAAVPAKKKAGDYIVLGKISQDGLPQPMPEDSAVTAIAWHQKVKETWAASSQAAKTTWHKYLTSSGAKELNTALRTGKLSQSQIAEVKAFNELLVDIPEGTTFTRSMGGNSYGATPNDAKLKALEAFILNAEPGTVVQEPGFTSTSWSGAHKVLSGNKFKWKFTAGKGVRAFPAWLSQNVGEGESLFPPNQRYMIRGWKKVGAQIEIDAVLLPTIEN
ncbi:hypothetical protein KL86PLE_100256 [uncultured Pleomorphomonas sp.]|uniref:Anti-CBASS protein Acb1 n=1 Tax=uncultured Pleomorphomonas sp. TaxID=442121 RepID=A0A212L1V4_9HYPH|nr:NUDIX domain-containing protein [uncultured Pleomorphomonas sp.]SCM71541.1 hypothetical protein KL86PLE_100256 [uncultured Pleomorphomonas sp.]